MWKGVGQGDKRQGVSSLAGPPVRVKKVWGQKIIVKVCAAQQFNLLLWEVQGRLRFPRTRLT